MNGPQENIALSQLVFLFCFSVFGAKGHQRGRVPTIVSNATRNFQNFKSNQRKLNYVLHFYVLFVTAFYPKNLATDGIQMGLGPSAETRAPKIKTRGPKLVKRG